MRIEQAQAKGRPKRGLMSAVMGLVLVAGVFLSLVAPTEVATSSSVEVGQPAAAAFTSTAPDSVSPGEEIAERDSLDLQLD